MRDIQLENELKNCDCDTTFFIFIRRHCMLAMLFFICLCMIIKNSSIPYLYVPIRILSLVFDKPNSVFWVELFKVIDVFSCSYVTSLIFYYVVYFIPYVEHEKSFKGIVLAEVNNLYYYLLCLLEIIKFFAERQHIWDSNDISRLDRFIAKNDEVWCEITENNSNSELPSSKRSETINLVVSLSVYKKLIIKQCQRISGVPKFRDGSDEIVECISKLMLSSLLRDLPEQNEVEFKNIEWKFNNFSSGYYELDAQRQVLENFIGYKKNYFIREMSFAEIDKAVEFRKKFWLEHPEIIKHFVDLYKANIQ